MRSALRWGWDFGLGQSADTWFQEPDGTWHWLGALQVPKDRLLYLSGIHLTREPVFGPVNLIASGDRTNQKQRYVATARPATRATFPWGRQRSGIAGAFRDENSGGFNLEETPLMDADRLKRLLLVMASGSLWCVRGGRWLCKTGQRRAVEAAKRRTLSSFRLGFDWLRRAYHHRTTGQNWLCSLHVNAEIKSDP
jgi:hypothetical protein